MCIRDRYILDELGTLRSFDAEGASIAEIETPIQKGRLVVDETSGLVAIAGGGSGVTVIVDPATGEVETVPTTSNITSTGFARAGSLFIFASVDGDVRLWEIGTDEPPTLVWNGTGATSAGPPWYDESTDSVWIATSGSIINVPLDANQWIERACQIVGRNLTQDEWDRFVPTNRPLQPACAN